MRRAVTAFVTVMALGVSWVIARGQDARPAGAQPQIVFAFERQGVPVPRFRFTVHRDGTAVYEGEEAPLAAGPAPAAAPDAAQPFHNQVSISPATVDKIFAQEKKLDRFNITCASKAKNIADTGTKTLNYTGSDGSGSCTYNYSENKDVQALTDIFQGMTETMDTGRRLDHLHRFDRLGLDEAIAFLAQEVSAGRALEVGTIAASLRSIAEDAQVIQRVRAKAQTLLALAPGVSGPQ